MDLDNSIVMAHIYGMATMNKRATFALDQETILRLKKLATIWHVSQAEVVRRAIKKTEIEFNTKTEEKLDQLLQYHKRKEIETGTADAYLEEVAESRSSWGRE